MIFRRKPENRHRRAAPRCKISCDSGRCKSLVECVCWSAEQPDLLPCNHGDSTRLGEPLQRSLIRVLFSKRGNERDAAIFRIPRRRWCGVKPFHSVVVVKKVGEQPGSMREICVTQA